jgi:hypothetical protein
MWSGRRELAAPEEPVAKEKGRKEKPRRKGEVFFFFYSRFRISDWWNKHAKFVWVSWLVSGELSGVITLDFGLPS